jgi:hypothetical protein
MLAIRTTPVSHTQLTNYFCGLSPAAVIRWAIRSSESLFFPQPKREYSDTFYQRSRQLHRDWGVDVGGIMGAIIAHEIGHLLLGSNAHAAIGIMRAHWQDAELRMLSKGELLFTTEQGARMRTNLVQEERAV